MCIRDRDKDSLEYQIAIKKYYQVDSSIKLMIRSFDVKIHSGKGLTSNDINYHINKIGANAKDFVLYYEDNSPSLEGCFGTIMQYFPEQEILDFHILLPVESTKKRLKKMYRAFDQCRLADWDYL